MRKFITLLAIIGIAMIFSRTVQAQGAISGYAFGDVYYVSKNHDASIEGSNGVWFRRIYLTFDHNISDEFSARMRLELASPGDFTTSATLTPVLKDGYLQWKRAGHAVIFGISPTPTFNYLESLWGYRSIEKTPADLYKFASSRDFGIAIKGKLDAAKKVHYHFMLGNGNSNKSENNKGKKVALALGYRLTPELTTEVYGDVEERPGNTNRYSYQGFLAYQNATVRLGAQYMHQTRKRNAGDLKLQIMSLFGAAKLKDNLSAFGRFDRSADPLAAGPGISYLPLSAVAKFSFFVFGLDFTPHEAVHFMPNIEIVSYDEVAGLSPESDVIPRITFYYKWK